MKRLILLISLFISISLQAQNMKELFVAMPMPDTLVSLLTKVNREDFGDFLASKMKAEVRNRFGKTSEMTELTDDYLYLKMTSASSMEMKLLPLNDSLKVVCVIQTYQAPVADSKVRFYDTDWKPLEASRFIDLPADNRWRPPVSLTCRPIPFSSVHRPIKSRLIRYRICVPILISVSRKLVFQPITGLFCSDILLLIIWIRQLLPIYRHILSGNRCGMCGKTDALSDPVNRNKDDSETEAGIL